MVAHEEKANNPVLIVAKCIVNLKVSKPFFKLSIVLIVAKCIVNHLN